MSIQNFDNSINDAFNIDKADWEKFETYLKFHQNHYKSTGQFEQKSSRNATRAMSFRNSQYLFIATFEMYV